MPEIRPFRALRYPPGTDLSRVVAPPYDVISEQRLEELESAYPQNIVHLTMPHARYQEAGTALRRWIAEGILTKEREEALFVYRSDFSADGKPSCSAGLVGAVRLDDGIFGHEATTSAPKADRLELLRATRCNLEMIWLLASEPIPAMDAAVEAVSGEDPAGDVTDDDGVRHRLFSLDRRAWDGLAAAVAATRLVIADGHHRYATSMSYRSERRASGGEGPWDFTLAMVGAPGPYAPQLKAIHRSVTRLRMSDIERLTHPSAFEGSLEELRHRVNEAGAGTIGVAGEGHRFTIRSPGGLDSAFLAGLFENLGAGDVSFDHSFEDLKGAVSRGAIGFVLAPVRTEQVVAVALAGQNAPPKTTLFWPKPRTGLVMRDLED